MNRAGQVCAGIVEALGTAWKAIDKRLTRRAERQVEAWGTSLLLKRRYTNPDDAKRFRKNVR